jgi:hypothetical protein
MSAPLQIARSPSGIPAAFGPAQTINAPVSGKRFELSFALATSATRPGAEQMTTATRSNAVMTERWRTRHLGYDAEHKALLTRCGNYRARRISPE